MDNESLTSSGTDSWKHYQFNYVDTVNAEQPLFDSIREKLRTNLNLQTDDLDINYEINNEQSTSLIDVYVREHANADQANSLTGSTSKEELIYQRESTSGIKPVKPKLATAFALFASTEDGDEPVVESIIFKEAIRKPPTTSGPLPI